MPHTAAKFRTSLFVRDRLIIPFIDRGDVTITVFLSIRTLSSSRQIEELNGCQEEKETQESTAESEKQRARRKVESAVAEEEEKEEEGAEVERSRFSVQGIRRSDTA